MTASVCPLEAAAISGVVPSLRAMPGSAPRPMSASESPPFWYLYDVSVIMSGVEPVSSTESMPPTLERMAFFLPTTASIPGIESHPLQTLTGGGDTA